MSALAELFVSKLLNKTWVSVSESIYSHQQRFWIHKNEFSLRPVALIPLQVRQSPLDHLCVDDVGSFK